MKDVLWALRYEWRVFQKYWQMLLPMILRSAYWRTYQHFSTHNTTLTCWYYTACLTLSASLIPKPKGKQANSNDQMKRLILSQWCILTMLALLWSSMTIHIYLTWDYTNTWTMKAYQHAEWMLEDELIDKDFVQTFIDFAEEWVWGKNNIIRSVLIDRYVQM
jgi:hypothetical protein